MPATGRIYLTVNRQIDERRDPIEATHAAAKYLRAAYNRIQDWPLALTSYNHGVAGVVSKVKKLGTNDIAEIVERPPERLFGFASSNFYPCFLAALEIYEQRERYFRNAQPAPVLRLAMTEMQSAVSVRYVTQTLGVPEDELRRLNYAISEQVWQGRAKIPAGYVLKVPQEYATKLGMLRIPETSPRVTEASSASSVYGGTIYKVRKGDTLGSIAKKYQTTPEKIRELNELGSSTIRIGQTLVVKPKHLESKPAHPGTERVAKEPARRESAPASTSSAKTPVVKYKVRSGDSWWRIAKTNRTTVDQLLKLNPTLGRTLRPGMLVRVR
jgi:membrane-bound lytic murein transglycosylase D